MKKQASVMLGKVTNIFLTLNYLPKKKSLSVSGDSGTRGISGSIKGFYLNLLTSCKLNSYLANVDKQAEDMSFRLEKEYAERAGSDRTVKGRKSVFMDSKDE